MEPLKHKLTIAGIGPGSRDYLLPAARRAIEDAKVLIGGKRALADFAKPAQRTYPVTSDIDGVVDFIKEALTTDDVVVMVSGDPGYYSLLDRLRLEFDAGVLEVIPGISALQLAFARLNMPWHGAKLLSFHGRRAADEELVYTAGKTLGLLTDNVNDSQKIAAVLKGLGWPDETKYFISSRLSYPDEEIIFTTLGEALTLPAVKSGIIIAQG